MREKGKVVKRADEEIEKENSKYYDKKLEIMVEILHDEPV